MASEWKEYPLKDLIDPERGISYGIVQPGFDVAGGVPILRVNNIRNGSLYTDEVMRVDPDIEAQYQRTRLRGGEVLLTVVGTVGGTAIVPSEAIGWNVARAIAVLPTAVEIEPEWLYIAIQSPPVQQLIQEWCNTTVQPTFNLRDVARLPIPVPPQSERAKIIEIIGSLDDKIELNRRMNATLEAIARALFKSWFVDFDPVRAKMEGRQPEGIDAETATLFPDRLVESELGLVPEGWETGTLADDFNLTMGQSPPGETYNEVGEGLPFYQGTRDFGFRYPSRRVYCTQPSRQAEAGDTLVSVRAPVGELNMSLEACCIGRGVAAVRHKSRSRSYTYYAASALKPYFENFEGEGTVFGSINASNFRNIPIILPPIEFITSFENYVYSIDQQFEVNERSSITLAETRDTLLPKLLSGEVRVGGMTNLA